MGGHSAAGNDERLDLSRILISSEKKTKQSEESHRSHRPFAAELGHHCGVAMTTGALCCFAVCVCVCVFFFFFTALPALLPFKDSNRFGFPRHLRASEKCNMRVFYFFDQTNQIFRVVLSKCYKVDIHDFEPNRLTNGYQMCYCAVFLTFPIFQSLYVCMFFCYFFFLSCNKCHCSYLWDVSLLKAMPEALMSVVLFTRKNRPMP